MLQPSKKSFQYYIIRWYEYGLWKRISDKNILKLFAPLCTIDDSILILDDIFDQSLSRNGNPCLYKEIWISWAILKAESLKSEFIASLLSIMKSLNTNIQNQLRVIELVSLFLGDVYQGESIDLELWSLQKVGKQTIARYFEMITLFTGWHIRYGLEIGQLISNTSIDTELSEIALKLWRIRQIYDDFEDYMLAHHEPFGDFTVHKNRLPELLFKLEWWDVKYVENVLQIGNLTEARSTILNDNVRTHLHNYCEQEHKDIQKLNTMFDYKDMIVDYAKILEL